MSERSPNYSFALAEDDVPCIERIEERLKTATEWLGQSLKFYDPSRSGVLPEAHLTIHFGRALAEDGFGVYPEAHSLGSLKQDQAISNTPDGRVDLLALEFEGELAIVAEFKRLFRDEGVRAINHDVDRLSRYRLLKIPKRTRPFRCYGVIGATTSNEDYAHRWTEEGLAPSDKKSWTSLDENSAFQNGIRAGRFPIFKATCGSPPPRELFLLYAVFPLPLASTDG